MFKERGSPARTTVLNCVQYSSSHGNAGIATGLGMRLVSDQTVETLSKYLHAHLQGSLRKAVISLCTRYPTI